MEIGIKFHLADYRGFANISISENFVRQSILPIHKAFYVVRRQSVRNKMRLNFRFETQFTDPALRLQSCSGYSQEPDAVASLDCEQSLIFLCKVTAREA